MSAPTAHGGDLPLVLFQSASLFHIKGRGDVVMGSASRRAVVRAGDLMEFRKDGRVLAAATVNAVEVACVSPPPPPDTDLLGVLVGPLDLPADKDDFEVWIVARAKKE